MAQYGAAGPAYFPGDALGSVRQLTDGTGAVTLTRSYQPYGEVMGSLGAGISNYGFTNEWNDSYIKLLYLRSRFYSPVTGRFQTRDTWQGDYTTPMSYNAWLYGFSNPVTYSDPSGYSPLAVFKSEKGVQWDWEEKGIVNAATWDVARAYARTYNRVWAKKHCNQFRVVIGAAQAFQAVHNGPIVFTRKAVSSNRYHCSSLSEEEKKKKDYCSEAKIDGGAWGWTVDENDIYVFSNVTNDNVISNKRFIVHEMGHAFEGGINANVYGEWGHLRTVLKNKHPEFLTERGKDVVNSYGYAGRYMDWQWSYTNSEGEHFADMYIGWVYNQWELSETGVGWSELGQARSKFMDTYLSIAIYQLINKRLKLDGAWR